METTPNNWRPEIDQYTIKFLIGFVACRCQCRVVLSVVLSHFNKPVVLVSRKPLVAQLFVGSLFAIAALLWATTVRV